MRVAEAGMTAPGGAPPLVTLRLVPTDTDSFAADAIAEAAPDPAPNPVLQPQQGTAGFVVALDPGHGGLDPAPGGTGRANPA